LGGRVSLDLARARAALEAVAKPIGLSCEDAALAALDILTQNMLGAIEEITVKQGIDPSRTVLIAGGGAAGFNGAAIGRRLNCRATLFPETGAVLSASGAMRSDLVFSDVRIHYARSDAADAPTVSRLLDDLQASAKAFVAASGSSASQIDLWVEARYPQQTWEIDIPIAWPAPGGMINMAGLVAAFHATHQALYAVSDPGSPVEFIAWRVRASAKLGSDGEQRLASAKAPTATSERRLYLAGRGWTEVPLFSLASLPEHSIAGPAIIESPFTTILVPAGCAARRLPSGTIEVTS
jgi:N-methylhydantoinase A